MSVATWKEEFYPLRAFEFNFSGTEREAIEHSLLKWRGLLPDNLARHGVEHTLDYIRADGEERFHINSNTCALCIKFLPTEGQDCRNCPLFKLLDGKRCDYYSVNHNTSPYGHLLRNGNPLPMVLLLEKALAQNTAPVEQ